MYNSISIIGPGLLGASIAMSISQKNLAKEIHLWARKKEKLNLCIEKSWCSFAHESLEDAVKNSEIIFLCTPVDTIIPILKIIAPHLKAGAIVTDVGSVKESICCQADQISKNAKFFFIGSHPMAGSEKSGMEHASEKLLKKATCIMTPSKETNLKALEEINQLWSKFDMNPVHMSPKDHDSLIAKISHLPHIASSILAASLDNIPTKQFKYAGGGLRDTTRVAGGSPALWQSIIAQNSNQILISIDKFEEKLLALKKSLISNDFDSLYQVLSDGQAVRKIIEKTK